MQEIFSLPPKIKTHSVREFVHFTHHIGTTGSSANESTAVWKEKVEAFVISGRWGDIPADVIVRSHRHRFIETRAMGRNGYHSAIVTPGWQLKTPFTYKVAGGRIAPPQFGAVLIRKGDRQIYTEPYVKHITNEEPQD